eukprot:g6479.t1
MKKKSFAYDFTDPKMGKKLSGDDPFHKTCDFEVIDVNDVHRQNSTRKKNGKRRPKSSIGERKTSSHMRPMSAQPILRGKLTDVTDNDEVNEETKEGKQKVIKAPRPLSAVEVRKRDPRFSKFLKSTTTDKKRPSSASVIKKEETLLGSVLCGGPIKFHMSNFHPEDPRNLRLTQSYQRGVSGRSRHSSAGTDVNSGLLSTTLSRLNNIYNSKDDRSGRRWNPSTTSAEKEEKWQTVMERNPFVREEALQRIAKRKAKITASTSCVPGDEEKTARALNEWAGRRSRKQQEKSKYRLTVPRGPKLQTYRLKGKKNYPSHGRRPKRNGMLLAQEPKIELKERRRRQRPLFFETKQNNRRFVSTMKRHEGFTKYFDTK